MALWALVNADNNVVGSLHEEGTPTDYPSNMKVIEVPVHFVEFFNTDYIVVAGEVEPPSLDYFNNQLFEALAAKRWDIQKAGVKIDGVVYPTDPESMNIIMQAGSLAILNELRDIVTGRIPIPINSISLKFDNTFVEIKENVLVKLLEVASTHIQSVFSIEKWSRNKVLNAPTYQEKYAAYLGTLKREWSPHIGVDHFIPVITKVNSLEELEGQEG